MNFFKKDSADSSDNSSSPSDVDSSVQNSQTTERKGVPTPRRRDVERARGIHHGPTAGAPMTSKEARKRARQLRASMTPAERKSRKKLSSSERSSLAAQRREAMARGDESALPARDKGEVRKYAREIADSRRSPLSFFMPVAIGILVLTLMPQPGLRNLAQLALYAFTLILIVESVTIGIVTNRRVRKKFPNTTDHGLRLGFYAAMRALSPRRWRIPNPTVSPGDSV